MSDEQALACMRVMSKALRCCSLWALRPPLNLPETWQSTLLRSDVFNLSISLLELLSPVPQFEGQRMALLLCPQTVSMLQAAESSGRRP